MKIWEIIPYDQYQRSHKKYVKKNSNVLTALLNNLDTFIELLNSNIPLIQIRFGWLHSEPKGVLAITEKGGHGKALKASRLYCYPDKINKILYLITIGDKNSQKNDIKLCTQFIKQLRSE